ncbi:MAG: PQQ-binding-like beta-propeller repeat protein [Pirellulales bacterium]
MSSQALFARFLCMVACCACGLAHRHSAAADPAKDWPQFLGPNRDGIVRDTGLNLDWKTKPPKTLWKVPIGSGFSSVSIVADRIYTQARREANDGVLCLDAKDGKERWFFEAAPTYLDMQKWGYGPRSTPTHHEGKLYCLFPMGELVCLTTEGKMVWQAEIFKDTGAKRPSEETLFWGVSMSPLVEGDLVIVQPGGTKDNSVAAYHKDTGKLVWTAGSDVIGYGSSIAITVAGNKQIVVPTGESILGIEPASGRVLWRYVFGNQYKATCASPVWADNLLFVSASHVGSAVVEIVPPEKAGATKAWTVREKWRNQKTMRNMMATSMILNGHIYGCSGDLSAFVLRCLDLPTGMVRWEHRLPDRCGLLALDGHLLCASERGDVLLVEAQPRAFIVKGELPKLLAYKTWAAPALAGGKLYLRDDRHLLCLDLRK